MISGGHHKNIFAVNLGQLTLDRDIKKLADEVSILQKGLSELTEGENGDNELNRVVKELSKTETELEFLKQKMTDNERQVKQFKSSNADSQSLIQGLEKTQSEQDKQIQQLS